MISVVFIVALPGNEVCVHPSHCSCEQGNLFFFKAQCIVHVAGLGIQLTPLVLQYSSLFLIMIFMSVFGTAQPYKSIIANILEVAMAADLLIMLLLKNTNGIYDFLQVLPAQTVQATSNATTCTDNDDIVGVTPLVGLLAPLYYIPLLITVVGGVIWIMYTFR